MWELIAGLVLAGIGAGMQSAGNAQSQRAMNQRTQEELNRQAQIQRKAEAEYATSLAGSGANVAADQIQQGTQERQGLYDKLQAAPLDTGAQAVGNQSPAVTLRDVAQMQLANKSRAKLGGYETWMLDQSIKNLRAQQNLGILNQQAVNSERILPLELQDASHKGDALRGAGMGVGALGSLLGAYGSLAGGIGAAGASGYGSFNSANSLQHAVPYTNWMGGI